ncbi:translocation/assembly module TamB domain-containing protein [Roseiterribacter gracilis]|uniref:Translocation/assembly module TamB n=1 Tax=Roseiterribacter gracilis TaxID=2812848 RepID=A0A8S8XL39_9PROT|nr:translocation/assembly module TamB [Rhodospirillales bacterium TMPK1]
MTRPAKIAAWVAGVIVAIPLLLVAGGWIWLQTDWGRSVVGASLASLVQGPDRKITLGRIGGSLPFHPRIERLSLSDRDGVWLTAQDVELDIVGTALLSRRARLTNLTAARIDIVRPPAPSATQEAPGEIKFLLPNLPVAIAVDTLSVPVIALGAPFLGEAATYKLSGHVRVDAEADAELALDRSDGSPGRVSLMTRHQNGRSEVQLVITEPTGRVLQRNLGHAAPKPFTLMLFGDGPDTQWRGTLGVEAGKSVDAARLNVSLAIDQAGSDRLLRIAGSATPGVVFDQRIARLLGGPASINMAVRLLQDGTLAIEPSSIAAPSLKLSGAFRGAPGDKPIAGTLTVEVANLGAFSEVAGEPLAGSARVEAKFTGTGAAPRITAHIDGTNVEAGAARIDTLVADIAGDRRASDGRFAGTAQLRANGMALGASKGDLVLDAAGNADRDLASIQLDRLHLNGLGVELDANGTSRGGGADGTAKLRVADLTTLAPIVGRPLTGALSLDGTAASRNGELTATMRGESQHLTIGIPALDALLGPNLHVTLDATKAGDRITARSVELASPQMKLGAKGTLQGEQIDADVTLHVADMAKVRPGLDGTANVTAHAEGAVSAPTGHVEAVLDGKALAARLIADAKRQQDATKLVAHATGGGAKLDADLLIADIGRADGTVKLDAPNLAAWAPLLGMTMTGRAAADVTLRATDGQRARIAARADALSVGTTSVQRATLDADLTGLATAPTGRANLQIDKAALGDIAVTRLRATATPAGPERVTIALDTSGDAGKPFQFALGGGLRMTAGARALTLSRLDGEVAGQKLILTRTATLAQQGDGMRLDTLSLKWGTAQLDASALVAGARVAAKASLRDLRVATLAALGEMRGASGVIEADLSLDGARSDPTGKLHVALRDLNLAAALRPDAKPLQIALDANLARRVVSLDGVATSPTGARLALTGRAPMLVDLQQNKVGLVQDGALALRLAGGGTLEDVADLLPIGEDRVEGRYDVDLHVDGTVARPLAGGRVAIANGRYLNQDSGAELRDAQIELQGDREHLTLTRFAGTDGAGGKVGARGAIDLAAMPAPSLDFHLALDGFRVAKRDDANVAVDGELAMTGSFIAARVDGKVQVRPDAELRIPEKLPASVATIEVIEIDSRKGKRAQAPGVKKPVFTVALDLGLVVPGRAYVRGRGLDSEWKGDVKIAGSTASPDVRGKLEVVRGQMALLGKDFALTRGVVEFDGGARVDPLLDIVAEANANDITARATISGRVNTPKIAFSSDPALPQDEVLARVLFGKNVGQISPIQGLQLAAAARELAGGGGPGFLDKIRQGMGLDRLDVGAGDAARSKGTTVSGGRYVADGVYLGVEQGTGSSASTRAKVEIEITPSINATSTVGAGQSGTGVGIEWKRDY